MTKSAVYSPAPFYLNTLINFRLTDYGNINIKEYYLQWQIIEGVAVWNVPRVKLMSPRQPPEMKGKFNTKLKM